MNDVGFRTGPEPNVVHKALIFDTVENDVLT